MKKENFGKAYIDHAAKEHESVHVIDQQREMQKQYLQEIWNKIDHNYSQGTCAKSLKCVCPTSYLEDGTVIPPSPFGNYDKTFYISVITKKERLFDKVFRNYFIVRKTCPTPEYDQSVFRFEIPSEKLQYLWTLPDKDTYNHLSTNRMSVVKEEYQLLSFVLSDMDGSLLRLAKELNGEKQDSILLQGN
jgi:hypothetical protein